jgi:hypothetical protein
MKLMQRLNKIKNKLDKESGSSKSGSHRSLNEKIITRSVSRYHDHSPRHSNKREHRNSIPPSVGKHKRYGVDELRGEMYKIKLPTFDGDHKKDEDADTWLLEHDKLFSIA